MTGSYKVGSMFAGIGGICLGFKQAGAEIVWANEIDEKASQTYIHNFKRSNYLQIGDIRDVTLNDDVELDVLTAGFPCQPFSKAGYRKGFNDIRGTLFFEVMKIVKMKRPRVVFLENVRNLKTHDQGNTYRTIISSLENEGYCITDKVMNTMDYGNIPQNRERIYIVAFKKDRDGLCKCFDNFSFPDKIELNVGIWDLMNYYDKKDDMYYYSSSHKYYPLLDKMIVNDNTVYQWRRVYVRENKNHVCPTLTANMGTGGHNVPIVRDCYGIRKITPEECLRFQGFPEWYNYPNISLCQKYKQIGNSVSVPVVRRIAEKIIGSMRAVDSNP